ncbi:hypothetical protein [Sphingobacterium griseoflavum]|uniref:Uncharacterized protein n=1 Tax=Sphingobacterium griseoflavum TaxID=1474952 RepID=A0ABQ3HY74_9SPHI|nr:hypothetical protein [Sphingobacterium griseoflavum]GHE37612.1 hypothetical protein GCM10017764_21130 [Sphingobacterium griseoflavum]
MKKIEAEKLVLTGTIFSSAYILLLMAFYYVPVKIELPNFFQVISGVFVELFTIPTIAFLVAALLFGMYKLIRKRLNIRVYFITALSLLSVLLIILTWK